MPKKILGVGDTYRLVVKIQKAIEFLNSQGYVVHVGRSSSPQLKRAKK